MKNILQLILVSLLFIGCGSKSTSEQEEHGHEHEDENSNSVSLTAEQMKSIDIQIGSIEKKQLTASLRANGILKVPNQNKANVTTLVAGTVRSILVQTGNTVKKGQVIATVASTGLISLQEEFLDVSAKTALAEIELTRQKELQQGNATALKTLQTSEANLKSLKAKKTSLQKQLELIGINPNSLNTENMQSVVSILSPIEGSVSNVMVNIGTYVDANNAIAEIIDNSQLHLDLYVYEKDLSKLKVSQTIHFTLTNNPGREYDADIYAISNTFEPNTKAVAVHASVKGDKSGLIDGMSITALVSLASATVTAVPIDAIVNHDGKDYIFIVSDKTEIHDEKDTSHKEEGHHHTPETGDHFEGEVTFERIPVARGTTDIGYSEVTLLKDIPPNSKIVIKGAFFILAKMTNQGEAHEH
jgi:membrane fusion protein, heavy metal efflux system